MHERMHEWFGQPVFVLQFYVCLYYIVTFENVTPVSVLHVIQTQRLGYTFGLQFI